MLNQRTESESDGRSGPLGRAGLVVAVALLGVVVLGAVAAPAAGQSGSNISAPALAYTETDGGPVHLVDGDGDTVDTGVNAKIIGPVADMDEDGTLEVTAVNNNGDLILIPAVSGASQTTLVSSTTSSDPAANTIGVGDYDGDGTPAVLYSNTSDNGYIYRVEAGGTPQLIYGGEETKGVFGYGDFTNDGNKEVVFRGSSEQIKWVDSNNNVGDTGTSNYGTNNGVGLGPLTDYDGDDVNRVSAVSGSNEPALIDDGGNFYKPAGSSYQKASKAPVAAADVTDDGNMEIMHRNTDTGSIYYMTTGGTSAEYKPGGSAITVSDAQGLSGTGVATRLNVTAADFTSPPNVTIDEPVEGEAYNSSEVPLNASANKASDWSYSVDGGSNQTASGANGTRTLNTTLAGLADGQHDVTVYATNSSVVGTATANFTVDTTAPTVSNFNVSNPEGQNVSVSFDSNEQLDSISVNITGAEDATLTESDFTRSGGTYTATYQGNSDGTYDATLETAEDAAGNDGATGQSDNTTVSTDTTAPTVTVTEPTEGKTYTSSDVPLNVTADESIANWTYSLDGGSNQSFTPNTTLSGLADGQHDVTVYAEDNDGNVGADTANFSVDTTAPSISNFSVSNPSGQNVSVSFDSSEELANISVNITGAEDATLTENDFTESGGTYTATYRGNSDGTYDATLETAEDAAGNDGATGQSDTTTVDTSAPGVTIDDPNESDTYASSSVGLNASANETSDWTYSVDGGTNQTASGANGTQTVNTTLSGLSDGDHTATVYADDGSGNVGSETVNFSVDTTAPSISNLSVSNPEGQNVSVSFDSSEELANISVNISGAEDATLTEGDFTYDAANGTYTATYQGNSDGTYDATLETAADAAGNDGATGQSDTTTVDTTAPTVTVTVPTEGTTYNSSDVPLNVTADESIADWTYSLDNGANQSFTPNTTLSGLADGPHNVTVYADDGNGNVGTETVNFTVDTTAPSIPDDSFTATNPAGQNVSVSFDSDEDLANISVDLSGPENATLTESDFTENNGTYTATYDGNSDGEYTATLETAEDAAGNDGATGQSDTTTVDTIAPTVTVTEPTEGTTYNSSEVPIPLNVTADESISNWTYSLDGGTNQSFTPNTTLSESELSEGKQNVTVYADDGSGNVGAETVNFTVDTTAPSIPADSFTATNPSGQNVSVSFDSSEELANISVDLTGPENATLTEADFTEDNGTYTATYRGNSDGTYNATLETAEDAAGNDGATGQSDTTTVDTATPTVSIAKPIEDEAYDSSDVPLNVTADESIANWTYSLDGGTNQSFTPNTTLSGLADGPHNVTVYAEDDSGNVGVEMVEFTVDTTAPSIPADSFTATNPAGQNVSVSFDSSEELANISVDLTGPENATLTEADFTYDAANGTYAATYDGNSDGEYGATLETAEDAAGNDGATGQSDDVTIDTADADDDSATGGGTDSDDETTVNAEDDSPDDDDDADGDRTPEAYVNVSNPQPGQTLLINETGATILDGDTPADSDAPEGDATDGDADDERAANVLPERLEVDLDTSEDFELSVQTYEDDLTPSRTLMSVGAERARTDDAVDSETVRPAADSFEAETDTVAAGYVRINTTLDAEEVDDATFEFGIRRSYLEELGVAPEEVTLYHRTDDGEWESRETTFLESGGTYHRFEGEMDEFSVFALGTSAPTTTVTDASLEETTVETGETATATATLTNRGQTATEETVQLTHDGDVVDTETVDLEGGETAAVTLTFAPDSAGEYDLSVGTADLETLTVEAGETATETEQVGETATDGDGAGFGAAVALAALCGAAFLLRRRNDQA